MKMGALSMRRVIGVIASIALLSSVFAGASAASVTESAVQPGLQSADRSDPTNNGGTINEPSTGTDPVVANDGFVTFTIVAPTATSVSVRGSWGLSFTNVAYPMSKSGDAWSVFLGPLSPGLYSYSFIVDGVATKDPNNSTTVQANPALSTFFVAGKEANFLAVHNGPKGALNTLTYHSAVTGTDRKATIWTPPGYTDSRKTDYPTFYLVHGGGGDYLDWVQEGRANVILDNLYNAHSLKPMVVVMVDGNIPGSTGVPQDDQFIPEVLDNLLPAVESGYRVSKSPSKRALAGLSLGGLQTFNMLLVKPGAFNYIGDFSSGYFPPIIDQIKASGLLSNKAINRQTKMFRIYIGNRADIAYTNNIATRAMFDQAHIKYSFAGEYPAGHVWNTWQFDLYDFAQRIF